MKIASVLVCLLLWCNCSSAQVGIGTLTPEATLDINGNLSIRKIPTKDETGKILILNKEHIIAQASLPNFYSIPGMKIPICQNSEVGTTDHFTIHIKNTEYQVSSKVLYKNIGAQNTEPITFPITSQNLQVEYIFDKALPFQPKGITLTALNNSDYPDTFSITYAQISATKLVVSISRKDIDSADDDDNCWAGQFYFDVLAYSF